MLICVYPNFMPSTKTLHYPQQQYQTSHIIADESSIPVITGTWLVAPPSLTLVRESLSAYLVSTHRSIQIHDWRTLQRRLLRRSALCSSSKTENPHINELRVTCQHTAESCKSFMSPMRVFWKLQTTCLRCTLPSLYDTYALSLEKWIDGFLSTPR